MSDLYILRGKEAVPVSGAVNWAEEMSKGKTDGSYHVGKTHVGHYWISTVFLGIDHNFSKGEPLLFETMIFKGSSMADLYMQRYATWKQAEARHKELAAMTEEQIAALCSGSEEESE